ncbi:MAG: hypothetical protein AAGU17_06025 [Anaerolineaceae bacterium]
MLPASLRSDDPCGDDLPKLGVGLEDAWFPCRFAPDQRLSARVATRFSPGWSGCCDYTLPVLTVKQGG